RQHLSPKENIFEQSAKGTVYRPTDRTDNINQFTSSLIYIYGPKTVQTSPIYDNIIPQNREFCNKFSLLYSLSLLYTKPLPALCRPQNRKTSRLQDFCPFFGNKKAETGKMSFPLEISDSFAI
ncbi:MAG: hypothetical protein IJU59_04990, partial [Firmicutes bacterium]|nr:hypothetical protein [Bacillota bacterium]